MSVSAQELGFAKNYIRSEKFIAQGGKEEGNDIEKLYKEGKEYTYLLTIAGKDSSIPVSIEPAFKNVISVEVVQARIPFTEYTIEDDRNSINYSVTWNSVTSTGSISLMSRDYTNDELIEEFNSRAKLAGPRLNLIRLGEEEGTGKFFFYTIKWDDVAANNMGAETDYNNANCPDFTIKASTSAFYPLGLSKTIPVADISGKEETYRIVINGVDATQNAVNGGVYKKSVRCPNRYNLVVSDLVVLRCDELDARLNREQTGKFVMPLAEFFLSSPGMNESTFQKAIPDRPIAPPVPLSQLTLRFTRENTGSNVGQTMNYDFRGIRWFIKIAVKTLEFPSSKVHETEDLEKITEGFKNTPISRNISIGPKPGVSSMMSRTPSMGRTSRQYNGIPSASNSSNYGGI
tara:strand:+ start:284 stop:1492 length:1209 start_codon:yes stop_codon:yes gene_type:complete